MPNHESKIKDEFEAIRDDIRYLISHPIDIVDLWISDLMKGTVTSEFGDSFRELPNLSLPRAEKFFQTIRDEVAVVYAQGLKLDRYLEEIILTDVAGRGGEDNLDHELAHIQKAEELGLDLGKCSLKYTFMKSPSDGLGLRIVFEVPPGTDVYTKVLVAMAPKKISDGDFNFVTLKVHLLTSAQREELRALYKAKAGVDVRVFKKED